MTEIQYRLSKIKDILESNTDDNIKILSIRTFTLNHNSIVRRLNCYSLDEIEQQITETFNVSAEQLSHKTRERHIVVLRQIAHYKAIRMTFYPLAEIGQRFGNLDHATVLNSEKKIQDLLDTDKYFREKYGEFLSN